MINVKKLCDKTILVLTLFWVVSICLFTQETWGRYVYLGASVAVFLFTAVRGYGRINLQVNSYHIYTIGFAIFCGLSAVWAWEPMASIDKWQTIISTIICCAMMYPFYSEQHSVESLITILMQAGYIVAIYSIRRFGVSTLLAATVSRNTRMEFGYDNSNTIGMICALTVVIQVYKIIYDEKSRWAILMIPTMLVIAASQSRKALILMSGGIMMVIVLKNLNNTNFLKGFGKTFLSIVIVIIAIIGLSQLSIFDGINERMQRMFASFTGNGIIDNSSIVREKMRQAGLAQFLKTPLLGIGIGGSGAIAEMSVGKRTYLHNNYVELLACGGVLGTLLYYGAYISCLNAFLRKQSIRNRQTVICIVIMFTQLVMDYGMVSYYDKLHYLYLMIFFVQRDNLLRGKVEPS